jgi:hypothetical protein
MPRLGRGSAPTEWLVSPPPSPTQSSLGGYPVALAFAGHTPATVTGRCLHATPAEVASAVGAMTGERHPLATAALTSAGRSECRRP